MDKVAAEETEITSRAHRSVPIEQLRPIFKNLNLPILTIKYTLGIPLFVCFLTVVHF